MCGDKRIPFAVFVSPRTDRDGKLYGIDFVQNTGLYLINIKTGFETAIAALPFGFSSALELASPEADADEDQDRPN